MKWLMKQFNGRDPGDIRGAYTYSCYEAKCCMAVLVSAHDFMWSFTDLCKLPQDGYGCGLALPADVFFSPNFSFLTTAALQLATVVSDSFVFLFAH